MSGAGLTDPIRYPQLWDYIVLGGITSPGLIPPGGISGFKREHEWDTKKGKGTKGATSTFVQKPPIKGTIKFWAWLTDHFVAWDTFYTQFQYDPSKKTVTGVDIYHPALADIELTAVLTVDIGMWEYKDDGLYERVVTLLEYFPTPPKPAIGTPAKATGGTGSYTNPDSKTATAGTPTPDATAVATGAAGDAAKQAGLP